MPEKKDLRETPLRAAHEALGARMVDFAGWNMPVQYTGIIEEHQTVRQAVGLFDISHMGQIFVRGTASESWANTLFTNDVRRLSPGDGQYTLMLNETGGVIDDLLIYRLDDQEFLLVVNASQCEKDFKWLQKWKNPNVELDNRYGESTGIAVQGPRAATLIDKVFPSEFHTPKRNEIATWAFAGAPVIVARTGYTGEDGFELFCDKETGPELWEKLMKEGKGLGCKPCGLGARDTLRLEACLPLYGQELGTSITPYEAGLNAFVVFDKPEKFIGRDVLREQKDKGLTRKSTAFEMSSAGAPPRAHYTVHKDGKQIGEVTSGTISPTLKKGIGMALLDIEATAPGTPIEIDIRGTKHPAVTVKKPIYKKSS